MMDKKTYNVNEEEYQFQEPEAAAHFSTTSPSPEASSIFERINRQNIIAGFIFILLIFGTYKLLSGLFHGISKQPVVAKVKPIAKIDPSKQGMVVNVDNTTSRLDHLAQGQLDVQSSIQSLDSELSSIQTTLANLTTQLTQVNDEIQSLHAGQATLIKSQIKPVKKPIAEKEIPKPVYYVRAMIPGRVWLTTQEGTTLTLGVSDKLAGYGVLDSINVNQGIVTFSSGAVIGYSPDDR
ncbi:hypothetical protein [Rickettsiella endosymbiont of Dermanyssus gallinae]|uniref:hypothetical protein n=1 Tax=Rickettsiella endosymbiont of Dermanyssus gallinae TaxID=2856608 RepID=UPI001C533019|nr:hypothetical protein [Rickettsiella endosymbiont of Dermanyssus gallinae]